jgi:TolB-like protein/Tfp pilus assembly protein PilF
LSVTEAPEGLTKALADRYRIERKIGSGGMAAVYLAEDLKHHRRVAVKVLHPELATTIGADRFLAEISVTANLQHPHILPLFDSGKAVAPSVPDPDGGPGGEAFLYYVMPYVEGESLRDRLDREKQLPLDDAVRIAREVADALSSAHSRGIVHRDIKPENILLQEGHAIVADFGIARAVQVSGGNRFTQTGMSVGTPPYMSPEQAVGDEDVDGRSDVYSLGCVLFEMLAGQPPFSGKTLDSIVHQHLAIDPPPVTNFRPTVPVEIAGALSRALAKAPADRFAPAAQFAEVLGRSMGQGLTSESPGLQRGVPVHPPGPGLWRKGLLGLIGLVVAAVVVVGARRVFVGGGMADLPGQIESLAVLPLVNLSGDPEQEYFADGMTEQLITELSKIGALRVISRTSVMLYRNTDEPLGDIARELGVDAVVEGSALKVGGRVRINAQLIEAATDRHLWAEAYERDMEDVLALQGDVARSIAREIQLTLTPTERAGLTDAETVDPAAHDAYLKGRYYWNKWTDEGFERALGYFDRAIELDPQYGQAYAARAIAYSTLGYFGALPPEIAFPQTKQSASMALDIDETLEEAHVALGMAAMFFDHDFGAASRELTRAVELNPGSVTAHQAFAFLQMALGNGTRAIVEMDRALGLDPLSLVINSDLGWVLFFARRYSDAIEHAREALELDENFFPVRMLLGRAYAQQGAFDEAIRELESAVTLSGRNHLILATLGEAYARGGRPGDARQILNELLALSEGGYVSPAAVAAVYIGLGETDLAFEWVNRAIEEHAGPVVYLLVDPLYDPLRGDSRFDELLGRLNLSGTGPGSSGG